MLENENMIDLLGSLKDMTSEQLSQLIQEETAKEVPDDEVVLMALDILEDREKEEPVKLGSKGRAAWKKYQSKARTRQQKMVQLWKPSMQVASVVLVITLLLALLPTQANAETWWDRLARWTNDFFSFFNQNESEKPEYEYVFQTDNEGLQQVYDAVVELGITDPVVPMWIPIEAELINIVHDSQPTQKVLSVVLTENTSQVIYQLRILSVDKEYQYHKIEQDVILYERNGTVFNIVRNNDNWSIVWTIENIECSIFIDCQEDYLYEIIDSIYRWRNNS